jgi:dienelactone hydrolase
MTRSASLVATVLVLLTLPAAAFGPNGEAFWVADGYPDQKRLGPAQAKGVVVYLHGISANKDSFHHPLPSYIRLFHMDGWEVLRHNRSNTQDRLHGSSQAILKAVQELKAAGYRKVVLAGQSRGAWFAVMVAGKSPDVFAAISTAPGGFGEANIGTLSRSAEELAEMLAEVRKARVMMFFFNGDPRENVPGGRGERSRHALTKAGVPFVVVNKPADFWGHGAAGSGRFTRRYGECIVRFVQADSLPSGRHDCDQGVGAASGADIPVAANLKPARPSAEIPAALAAFAGQWYGDYEDGAARLLTLTALNADGTARAVYAGAPRPGTDAKPFSRTVSGRLDSGALVFPESRGTLTYRLQPEGSLHGTWKPSGDGKLLELVMRRRGEAAPK